MGFILKKILTLNVVNFDHYPHINESSLESLKGSKDRKAWGQLFPVSGSVPSHCTSGLGLVNKMKIAEGIQPHLELSGSVLWDCP
jgi:hypothetical protein